MRGAHRPVEFDAASRDPRTGPARLSVAYPERLSRGLIFVKWLLIIPHLIVLLFVLIGASFAGIAAFFIVLFTGRWPEGLRSFLIGTFRWSTRMTAYAYLMTDVYPPFPLDH